MSSYKVPTMGEVEATPWNGFNVVSTFSGGGGSCLGYRMAGYRVRWANEFIPDAQETYRRNHRDTFLNTKDIRDVTPEEVLEQSGLDEIDIFDGSPPCAPFSTCGAREKYWGRVKSYSDTKQVVDDLFFEYTRLLKGLQLKVFIAENVSGLVKGAAKGYFKRILKDMAFCGYEVSARLLDSSMLGVPQKRERLIFVGVRKDLCEEFGVHPVHPTPDPCTYTLRDAIGGLESGDEEIIYATPNGKTYEILAALPRHPKKILQGSVVAGEGKWFNLKRLSWELPCSTVMQATNQLGHPDEDRFLTISELKRVMSVPDDFVLTGGPAKQLERLGRMVPPVMMSKVAKTVEEQILCKTSC